MNVGFFTVYHGGLRYNETVHLVLADRMIRSVRKEMPKVEIVQLTDEKTPAIMGVDRVQRLPGDVPMAVQCVRHYAACQGDWLLIDTDVIVQDDVRDVFDEPFDVAVCDRDGTLVEGEEDLQMMKEMPHNIGVMFSRSKAFWKAVEAKMHDMTPERKHWLGNQYAACDVIASGQFHVKIIPGIQYNYAAHNVHDKCESASIVHYKGPMRKKLMLERFQEV